ncbi:MAG: hypothetical protein ACLSDQ_10840 [Adlercreutzia equolifaciens]
MTFCAEHLRPARRHLLDCRRTPCATPDPDRRTPTAPPSTTCWLWATSSLATPWRPWPARWVWTPRTCRPPSTPTTPWWKAAPTSSASWPTIPPTRP